MRKDEDDDLETQALVALDELPHGPERTEAMKKAGKLLNAADRCGISFAKTGKPRRVL